MANLGLDAPRCRWRPRPCLSLHFSAFCLLAFYPAFRRLVDAAASCLKDVAETPPADRQHLPAAVTMSHLGSGPSGSGQVYG